jgi:hypothetical protein
MAPFMRNTPYKGLLPHCVYRAGTCASYILVTQRVCGLIFGHNPLRSKGYFCLGSVSLDPEITGKTHPRLILAFIMSVGLWIRFPPLERKGQKIRGNYGRIYKKAYVHRVLKGPNPQYILFSSSDTLYTFSQQCR